MKVSTPPLHHSQSTTGVALVLVLASLVLLSLLVVAFMSSVSTEMTASSTYASGTEVRQLAESTVNLVISQIRDATTSPDETKPRAWASQPGAIRTYGDDSTVYKTYSADVLQVSEGAYDAITDTVADWDPAAPTAGFTDLNSPILTNGAAHYPIVDPTATFADGKVEGFELAKKEMKDKDGNPVRILPLPVKWLYILKDGTVISLKNTTVKPTALNPIVGRTAFWTDDETSKVNVNTASEGTYWDTPVVAHRRESGDIDGTGRVITTGPFDLNLAVSQPTKGEYQRYSGHPATTSLSPILRWCFPSLPAATVNHDRAFKNRLYDLLPHVVSGYVSAAKDNSSGAGVWNPTAPISGNNSQTAAAPLLDDGERLLASVDELVFQPKMNGLQRVSNTELAAPDLTQQKLEKVRFFLTANSRSPDLNLFGQPRVTIWPVPLAENMRTKYDKLFAFCSRVAGKDYMLTRFISTVPKESGARFSTKDFDTNSRNGGVFNYLRSLTSRKIPGFGDDTMAGKYDGGECDQILTEMLDYIRCTNLTDTTNFGKGGLPSAGGAAVPYTPPYTAGGTYVEGSLGTEWSGQVVPLRIGDSQGLGRFVTLKEMGLLFYAPTPKTPPNPASTEATEIRAVLLFEFATPMAGYAGLRDTFAFSVSVDSPMMIKALPDGAEQQVFPTAGGFIGKNLVEVDSLNSAFGRPHTGVRGFTMAMYRSPGVGKTFTITDRSRIKVGEYPFVSDPITVKKASNASGDIEIRGGTFTVSIYAIDRATALSDSTLSNAFPTQTIRLKFLEDNEAQKLPKPRFVAAGPDFDKRLASTGKDTTILADDIVRSIEVGNKAKGDYRLVAATTEITPGTGTGNDLFDKRSGPNSTSKSWTNANVRSAHGFQYGHGDPYIGNTPYGKYVKNQAIRGDKPPDVPEEVNGVETSLNKGQGDWDRGVSKHPDGAYANKPDDGNIYFDMTAAAGDRLRLPYYRGPSAAFVRDTYFTPARLISSPVMFGGLPTGVKRHKPWETLLFRPDRPERTHPGAISPPDHLFLDLFNMPIVEPYAISEPLSTAGRVNMNYALAPFSYVQNSDGKPYLIRDQGMRAVLKPVKMMAIPNNMAEAGHGEQTTQITTPANVRFDIDLDKTLKLFTDRLKDPKKPIFKSATEICEMDLCPVGQNLSTPADFGTFWNNHGQTADNGRERPYSYIYPRVTTKSNTYTVHMRVQTVKKNPNTAVDTFDEKRDLVTGEYRGSTIIERFIDPNDQALAGIDPDQKNLESFYKFRIISNQRFAE